jgi:hypothetical protein
MYSDIGQKSNTMIFADRPGDINALMAQASTVIKSLSEPKGIVDSRQQVKSDSSPTSPEQHSGAIVV